MKKYVILIIVLILSCSAPVSRFTTIKIIGSDTMYNLVHLLTEEYMKKNPGITIMVESGGTRIGINAIIDGTANICSASRTLESEEIRLMTEKFGTVGLSFIVAKDALSIYVNKNNTIDNLSTDNIRDIYSGKIRNWKELGGQDLPILKYIRNTNSGTYFFFKQHIMSDEEFDENCIVKLSTDNVLDAVNSSINAIGFGGYTPDTSIKLLKIDNLELNEYSILNSSYPFTRYLYFYTVSNPDSEVKRFIDWVIGPEGQNIVKESGFISPWRKSF